MDSRQFQLFRQITLDYFGKLSPGEAPAVDPPFLQFGPPALLDYASLIAIRGEYEGVLYLTSSVALLSELLALHREAEVSPRTLGDMCRELSNVLSGNASRAFAGDWQISVPHSLGPADLAGVELPPASFVLPMHWRAAPALLVIGLRPRGGVG